MENLWKIILSVRLLLFLCLHPCGSQLIDIINTFGQLFRNADEKLDKTSFLQQYDFIVVGAGSAGSVLASRLSENPNWKVLLLEAGKEENIFTDIPLLATLHFSSSYNWNYRSKKSNNSCLSLINGRCPIARGKSLGGTSVINFMVYTRGNKLDYDEWKNAGNEGWGYDDVLPYFIKSENCSYKVHGAGDGSRGRNGYLHVEHPPFSTPLRDRFIRAGLELGYKERDPNGRFHVGFSKVQATMVKGHRESSAKAYLKPAHKRSNLDIVTEAFVTKILLDPNNKKALGVEFVKNGIKHRVVVTKEVLLSAGSTNSPQLLMLSGIGPKSVLERFNITVLQNLQVGYNLQDHVSFAFTFLVNDSVTISDLSVATPLNFVDYWINGKGPLTLPGGAEAVAFVKSMYSAESNPDYPDIELVLGAAGLNGDFSGSFSRAIGVPNKLFSEVYGPVLFKPAFSITTVLLKPRSRGRVTIKSNNPLHAPVIDLNYFHDDLDVQVMVNGLTMAKLIGQSESFQKYNAKLHDVVIPRCKSFVTGTSEHDVCLIKNLASSIGHLVGTCKMGPVGDSSAVVDPELRVHGIKGLRVVDGSIMPSIVTGHTNSVVMMIGEKASDLIKSAWRNQ